MQPDKPDSKPRWPICAAILLVAVAAAWLMWPGRQSGAFSNLPVETASSESASPAVSKADPDAVLDPALELALKDAPDLIPISLRSVVGSRDRDSMDAEEVMRIMPRGKQSFGAIEFLIEGVVNLDGSGSSDAGLDFRKSVTVPITLAGQADGQTEVVPRGAGIACLHLVGATRYSTGVGETFAEIVWYYTDGTSSRSPIKYAVHLRDWWRSYFEQPNQLSDPLTKIAWKQPHPSINDRSVRLYRLTVENPQPKRTIKDLEFVGGISRPGLFFIALTLDRLKPGQRPDDLTHEEMPDPKLSGQLKVYVQTPDGFPIANASITASARDESSRYSPATPGATTDENGMANVQFQREKLARLEVAVTHDDYAGRKMVWDVKAGDTVPASYVFKLSPGVTLGGTVLEEPDYPVAGVKLSFYRYWTGSDEVNEKGEQFEFRNQSATTDGAGVWQIKNVPEALLDRIGFRIEHADFVRTNLNVGNDATTRKQLRDGTHKLVLKRGLEAWGVVMDESSSPVANAKVAAGRRYFADRRDTTTDSRGQFYLKPLAEGDVLFSVVASGYAPESKTLRVYSGMAPIYFNLAPGKSIRGIVVDESNVPLSGVRVVLEGQGGSMDLPYEFSTNTKEDGRFEWDGAPNKAMPFTFLKSGYSAVRNQMLEPGKDNIVTLKPPRIFKGIVLDDTTGQPVTKFRAGVGQSFQPGTFYNNHSGMKEFASATGQFELEATEPYMDAVKVEADEYAEQVKAVAAKDSQTQTLEFRLKPSQPINGMVVNQQGAAVAGAQVALVKEGFGDGRVRLEGNRLVSWGGGAKIVTTDSEGRFKLGTPPETGGRVVAASPNGIGSATVDQVRATGYVMVQSNGRIEGTLKIAGQPAPGYSILFTLQNQGIDTDFQQFQAKTDEAGKFVFDNVPSGEGSLVRLIQTRENSWLHSHTTTVKVEPGKTTYVTLGDAGAVIRGRIRYETPPDAGVTIWISGGLNTAMPPMPSFSSSADAQAFMASAEWKERMKAMKHFGFAVGADGAFQVDSIPPGDYSLHVSATKPKDGGAQWETEMVATGSRTVTVPDTSTPYSPIDVGEVLLKPMPRNVNF